MKYSLHLSDKVNPQTDVTIFELLINDKNLFEKFCKKVLKDGNLKNELSKTMAIIEQASSGYLLPAKKHNKINTGSATFQIFEAKAKILRVYYFIDEKNGNVIIIGGKKGNQKKDIEFVTKTVKEYFDERE